MVARVALVAAAMLFAFVLGWVIAPAPSASAQAGRALRLAALQLDAPAPRAAAAAAELARLHGAPAAAPAARPSAPATAPLAPAPPPPPPPPQADAVLRSQLAAVEGQEGDLRLMLAGARRLRVGDPFMGWRVAALSRTTAVLARGGERRTVDFFAPAPPAPAPPTAGPPAGPRLAAPAVEGGGRRSPTAAEFFSGFKG